MSSDHDLVLEVLPPGTGLVLDLGGGRGMLRRSLQSLGYRYVNFDIKRFENGEPTLVGSAHQLPFRESKFDVVVSKDTLEHFSDPQTAVQEVQRILKPGGQFIVVVPFLHPFHGDDYYRYSPLGLRHLFRDFEIVAIESPLWAFTVIGFAFIEVLKRLRLGLAERSIKSLCARIDRIFMNNGKRLSSFAATYRVILMKKVPLN